MDIKQLKNDKVYEIHHERKGKFVAVLLDVIPADKGDECDEVYLYIRYDVRTGTDQARLQTTGSKQRYRKSNIRPSLILQIEEYQGDHWLRELPSSPEPVKPSLLGKVKKGLFGE